MAIESVGSTIVPQQLTSTTPAAPTSSRDADNDGSTVGSAAAGGGRFSTAISQALTSIGITPADASGSAAATGAEAQSPAQASQAFTQALFGALQGDGAATNGDAVKPAGGGHHHHGGGKGKVESGLQNLIQQIGSAGSASNASGSAATPASDGGTLATLQTAFDNLVTSNGGSSGSASLSGFLQNLAQNLNGAPTAGNVVSTSA
jgi:hypothetical protein